MRTGSRRPLLPRRFPVGTALCPPGTSFSQERNRYCLTSGMTILSRQKFDSQISQILTPKFSFMARNIDGSALAMQLVPVETFGIRMRSLIQLPKNPVTRRRVDYRATVQSANHDHCF